MRRRRSFLFIALKTVGNLSLAWGMKHFLHVMSANPISFIQAMFDPVCRHNSKGLRWHLECVCGLSDLLRLALGGVVRFARNPSFLERR